MLERNQEAQEETNDVLGYHNHNYFQKYLKINKLRITGVDEAQWEVKYSLFAINYFEVYYSLH